jgi:hypothetical protein
LPLRPCAAPATLALASAAGASAFAFGARVAGFGARVVAFAWVGSFLGALGALRPALRAAGARRLVTFLARAEVAAAIALVRLLR